MAGRRHVHPPGPDLALLRADIVAIGGGGIFGNGMKGLTSLLPTVALAAQRLGKETVVPGHRRLHQRTALGRRRACAGPPRPAAWSSARDLESAEVLGPGPNTVQVDDPALTLEPAPADVARAGSSRTEAGAAPPTLWACP